ncbi:hypothetical protein L3X38_002974 [Prunus dulcis]|uniref:Uncharacterized protein n=1 Tax=Prunus dulcis TaxID=3755 RepID=A0AAD4WVQ5_PRUDU|nr:hypothetical protein L3X38_002974 [Prunus dulcis]
MGSVNTPDNLRHVRPCHTITYLPIRRYNQRHAWGLSQRRITYATWDLNIISQISPIRRYKPAPRMGPVDTPDNLRHVRPQHNTTLSPIRRYNQRHVWGLSQRRITYAT